jgi:arsenite-transporting ATPase
MGKGGVGKTTIASALALGLVAQGHRVHLTTTDPAAHLEITLGGNTDGLQVSRIDPKAETQRYIDKMMATRGKRLTTEERALLLEDLQSPCTEEVAVFHAFSHTVAQASKGFVVVDTAPTGHTLLLMDATGAYHRQMLRGLGEQSSGRVVTPLMRLRDPAYTQVILVALPEPTPVSQASALQEDLRRAGVEPYAWVLNRSLLAAAPKDPLLRARLLGEARQIERIRSGLAKKLFVIPWQARPLVGVRSLKALAE